MPIYTMNLWGGSPTSNKKAKRFSPCVLYSSPYPSVLPTWGSFAGPDQSCVVAVAHLTFACNSRLYSQIVFFFLPTLSQVSLHFCCLPVLNFLFAPLLPASSSTASYSCHQDWQGHLTDKGVTYSPTMLGDERVWKTARAYADVYKTCALV
jgi:hypothetical protein